MRNFFKFLVVGFLFFPSLAFASQTITWAGSTDNANDFGRPSPNAVKEATPFTPSANYTIATPSVSVFKVGSPSDNVLISIQGDSSGHPDGVDIGSVTYPGASLGGSAPSPINLGTISATLNSGTQYWLVFYRDGAESDTDYYKVANHSSSGFNSYLFASGTWSNVGGGGYGFYGSIFLDTAAPSVGGDTATSSVDKALDVTYYGFIIFMSGFWGVIWFFKRR